MTSVVTVLEAPSLFPFTITHVIWLLILGLEQRMYVEIYIIMKTKK